MPSKPLLFALVAAFCCLARAGAQDMIVYYDALESGWQNYGWATINCANRQPVFDGSCSISVTDTNGHFQALSLGHSPFDSSPYQAISFQVYPTVSGSNELQVRAMVAGEPQAPAPLSFTPAQVGHWQLITVPLSQLGAANNPAFSGFWIQNISGTPLTFYVDDISLVAIPIPRTVSLAVNARQAIRSVDPRLYGVNLAIWDRYLAAPPSAGILAAIGAGAVRFPGGSGSDVYDWHTNRRGGGPNSKPWPSNAATFARVTEAQRAQPFITVNYGSGTPEEAAAWVAYYNGTPASTIRLGIDSKGIDWKIAGYWAALRAETPLAIDDGYNFLRVAHPAPYGFRYWEIGNECYGHWEFDQHGMPGSGLEGAPHDPYTYAQAFRSFRDRMLEVDPSLLIGAVAEPSHDASGNHRHSVSKPNEGGAPRSGWTPVVLSTLHSLGVTPAFLIDHYYPQEPGREDDALLLQAGSILRKNAADLRHMIGSYLGASGSGVELDVTELNSVSSNPGKQSTSLVNGLFMADAIGNLAQTEFRACTWWALRNGTVAHANNSPLLHGWRDFGDYGIVSSGGPGTPVNTKFPTYYAAKLLTHWARGGDEIVSASSGYPLLSVYAARLASGSLALLVINKHPTADLDATISLAGFTPSGSVGALYSYGKMNDLNQTDITTGDIPVSGASIRWVFPAYSMSVVVLPGKP